MWHGWVTAILGIWLALAPFVAMDVYSVRLNNMTIGILVAWGCGDTPTEKAWKGGLGCIAGIWVALSTFFRVFWAGPGYQWSNVIAGFLILTSGCSMLAEPRDEKYAQ